VLGAAETPNLFFGFVTLARVGDACMPYGPGPVHCGHTKPQPRHKRRGAVVDRARTVWHPCGRRRERGSRRRPSLNRHPPRKPHPQRSAPRPDPSEAEAPLTLTLTLTLFLFLFLFLTLTLTLPEPRTTTNPGRGDTESAGQVNPPPSAIDIHPAGSAWMMGPIRTTNHGTGSLADRRLTP
jgi:hypothetical protein